MKRFKLVVLEGLVTVFFIAGMAFAQSQGGQGAPRMGCQERFDALDTNHDGKLTLEEFMAKRQNDLIHLKPVFLRRLRFPHSCC